jgi:AhpD family alkylhydroperoxidase
MRQRIDYRKVAPNAYKAMLAIENYVRDSGLDHALLELMKTRVSQINGCAHCLDMHTKEARASGETEQRLHVLAAWRDAPFYSGRERAALAWAEALTQISTHAISDELFAEARDHFGEKGLVDLTLAIIAINGWNRLAVPFRAETGSYQPVRGAIASQQRSAHGTRPPAAHGLRKSGN